MSIVDIITGIGVWLFSLAFVFTNLLIIGWFIDHVLMKNPSEAPKIRENR